MVDSVRSGGIGAPPPPSRDKSAPAGAGFFPRANGGQPMRPANISATPPLGLDGMLALQGVDDPLARDNAARKRGKAMIAALSDLQRAMLAQDDPSLTLRSLSELAADHPDAADPALAAVLRSVVLRARVEVAKGDSIGRGIVARA